MFDISTIGLVLTVCVMRNGAHLNGCERCWERLENGVVTTWGRGRALFPQDPVFMADCSNVSYEIKKDKRIAFDKVYSNVGNNYKLELGFFIAPFKGSYLFNVAAVSNGTFELGIIPNIDEVGTVDNKLQSSTFILEVTKNDMISVKVKMAQESATVSHCRFGGFIIMKD